VACGAAVVLTGRPQPLRDLAAELGEQAVAVPADAASAADMVAVAGTAVARFGGISTLVASAGGPGWVRTPMADEEMDLPTIAVDPPAG
jgi:meso-butanediol dehydrogenase / (S,S)-butanediol dehydrogenase / diacetyl reductase